MDNKEVVHTVERLFLSVPIIFYLVAIIFFAFISHSPIPAVFLGMTASLAHLITLIVLTAYRLNHHWIIWALPIVSVSLFGFIADKGTFSILEQMELPSVIVLNVVVSFILNLLFYNPKYIGSDGEAEKLRQQLQEYKNQLHVTKENMQTSLRSIEDKCKAYNFVIGRVYSDKKGGSKKIRDMINIPRELYNRFTELAEHLEDKEELEKVLDGILARLTLAEKEESGLFKIGKATTEVKRSEHNTILDILSANDKDPVNDYHAEAKEICTQVLKVLKE